MPDDPPEDPNGVDEDFEGLSLDSQFIMCDACNRVFRGADAPVALLGHIGVTQNPSGRVGAAGRSPAPRDAGGGPKRPNLDCPKISDQCTPVQWGNFVKEWKAYASASSLAILRTTSPPSTFSHAWTWK